jgi:hypothetical protein
MCATRPFEAGDVADRTRRDEPNAGGTQLFQHGPEHRFRTVRENGGRRIERSFEKAQMMPITVRLVRGGQKATVVGQG